jgi:3-hydroxyisobutyrate dehydrogenase-like beta-hydroxyacid dehydrogenase
MRGKFMSEVSVIGLGPMGVAMARTFLSAGHKVTVWNRTISKADDLLQVGAIKAESAGDCIKSSPLTVVCLNNYETSGRLLERADANLEKRTIVQLGTGKPHEARRAADFFASRQARYLDGALLCAPDRVGTDQGMILIAGDEAVWSANQPVLSCLSSNIKFTGPQIDTAKLLDFAYLSQRLGTFIGALQGVLLCQAGGLDAETFAATVAADARTAQLARVVQQASFDVPVNSVEAWAAGMEQLIGQAHESGANAEVLEFFGALIERANADGLGKEDFAAVIKVISRTFRNPAHD